MLVQSQSINYDGVDILRKVSDMKKKNLIVALLVLALAISTSMAVSFAQMQPQGTEKDCETCPMKVGADAIQHLNVVDGNGTRHYVECIGCAMKLLKTCDTIHIETYCDWYGPNYPITADISQHGAATIVDPTSALLLVGGGCTGNRVAYNQTAADLLLANGFSGNTMMMMQQPLPANTNITTLDKKAQSFALADTTTETPQSPFVPILLGVVAVSIVVVAVVAYKKIKQ